MTLSIRTQTPERPGPPSLVLNGTKAEWNDVWLRLIIRNPIKRSGGAVLVACVGTVDLRYSLFPTVP